MTINGVQACSGGGGGGARWHNKSLYMGKWNNILACPGGIYNSVPGGSRYSISLSRSAFLYCSPGGGGGGGGGL